MCVDAFKGIYKGMDISSDLLPMIHVHCFTRSADPIQDIKQVKKKFITSYPFG